MTPARTRHDSLDALRGLAIVWMTVFHFCFDLNHFGWIRQDFYQAPLWTWQRSCIVSLFLLCAGLGQAVAQSQGQDWPRFWRRWAQVAGCAVLVSIGSWWMFPNSFIHFGVLHGIAVMLLFVRLSAGWGRWLWPAGALALAAWQVLPVLLVGTGLEPAFNGRGLNWLGIITRKPVTEDYVPVLPWLAVMWWGMAAGQWALAHRPGWFFRLEGKGGRALSWLGRHSLAWYMLHQPVLIGLLAAAAALGLRP